MGLFNRASLRLALGLVAAVQRAVFTSAHFAHLRKRDFVLTCLPARV